MILVTGATGHVGSEVERLLRGRGLAVRAFVRDEARAKAGLGDVELAIGDFGDRASLGRALDGATDVLLSCPNGPRQVEWESNVIDASKAAGVKRIVKISTVGAEVGSPLAFWDWHGRSEQYLKQSGVSWVILHGGFYYTNLVMMADPIKMMNKVLAPAPNARVGMVDPRDVAVAAAEIIASPGHEGETVTITGPESLTFEKVAADLSVATGRDIDFVAPPVEMARAGMIAGGIPESDADILIVLYRLMNEGAGAVTTNTFRALTGREPRSFAEFARENASAFQP
jgi:uncharacterized protein YbjT (DUF2867 family)